MTEELDNEPWFEIERRLRDDADGRERDTLLSRIDEAAHTIKRRLDAGVAPAEFAGLNTVYNGFEAAREVVEKVWRSSHNL